MENVNQERRGKAGEEEVKSASSAGLDLGPYGNEMCIVTWQITTFTCRLCVVCAIQLYCTYVDVPTIYDATTE
jgi:hypothetical protein